MSEHSTIKAREAFHQLTLLVGKWQGTNQSGKLWQVSYRLLANETVLMETWTLAPGREAMTVYHLDGPHLLATHYCPLGNQPRLRLQSSDGQRFVFTFMDATNLATANDAHQHQFEIRIYGPDSFARSETYIENGITESEEVTYFRLTEIPPGTA